MLRAEDPDEYGQQRSVLVSGGGLVSRLPGPAGDISSGGQGIRALRAQHPLQDRQQRGELVTGPRQLVCRHFDDVGALLLALLADRFGEDGAHPGQARADGRPAGLARSMAQRAMSRPAADRRLLRSVLAASDERRPELTRVISALRAEIIDRWIGLAPDGKTDAAARAWVWAVFNAQFGLWDLVDAGDIDSEQAADVLIRIIQDHFAAERPEVAAQAQQPDPLGLRQHPGVFSDWQVAATARSRRLRRTDTRRFFFRAAIRR